MVRRREGHEEKSLWQEANAYENRRATLVMNEGPASRYGEFGMQPGKESDRHAPGKRSWRQVVSPAFKIMVQITHIVSRFIKSFRVSFPAGSKSIMSVVEIFSGRQI